MTKRAPQARPVRVPFLVVGAGISGLSAALLLARRGHPVEVWERDDNAGGLLAPVSVRGIACDRGSHRLHPEAYGLLFDLTAASAWLTRPRQGRLLLGGRQLRYPPRPVDFLRGLGFAAATDMALGFVTRPGAWRRFRGWERDRGDVHATDEGFEDFVLSRVGRGAYERFYRPYVEKVWGESARDLSQSVAKQRVSMSSPASVLGRALSPKARQPAQFRYPAAGMAGIVADLTGQLRRLGVVISHRRRANLQTLRQSNCERILFGGDLRDVAPLGAAPQLSHRGLYLVHVVVPSNADAVAAADAAADAAAYVDTFYAPESRFWFGRVSLVERFSPEMARPGEAIFCVEVPEGRWGREHSFTDPATLRCLMEQLCDAGIVKSAELPIEAIQTYVPNVYPMYRQGWLSKWQQTLAQLTAVEPRLIPMGRQGLFLHCNMDHCVRIANDAVEHAVAGGPASAWLRHVESYLDLRVRD